MNAVGNDTGRRLEIFSFAGELWCRVIGFEEQALSAEQERLLEKARPSFARMALARAEVEMRQEARRRARAAVKA